MQAVHPGRKTLEEMARWTPATVTAWRFGRLLKAAYWNVHLLVSWLAQDLLATLPAPANGILYLFGDGSRADKRGAHTCGAERAYQSAPSLVFWPALRVVDGGVGRLSRAGKLSNRLPKRHAAYRSENVLFREMVEAFVPPSWAKLVIVGGDAAYGSKANMRMVQDRDKADTARRWGFIFAIARTWKTVEDEWIKNLVTHVPRGVTSAPGFPEREEKAQDFLDI